MQVSSSPMRQQVMSPEPSSSSLRAKKPGLGRKPSKLPAPQKGQDFSADDDADEYESNFAQVQRRTASRAANGVGRRRQSSTLRRRPIAHAPNLPRVESQDEDDQGLRGRTPTTPAPSRSKILRPQETRLKMMRAQTAKMMVTTKMKTLAMLRASRSETSKRPSIKHIHLVSGYGSLRCIRRTDPSRRPPKGIFIHHLAAE